MTFAWPQALLLLLLVPLGLLAFRAIDRRQRRKIAAFGGFGPAAAATAAGATVPSPTVPGATPTATRPPARRRPGRLRRTLPGALLVLGLTVMLVALARPHGEVSVPHQEGTVILAFDISGSMAGTDLLPTRLDAARAAAKDFVERQPASVVVGVVAFSDSGVAVQQPSNDQATVLAAIDRLAPQRGTSVGQGILASLATIATAAAGPNVDYYSNRSPDPTPEPTPVPAGVHAPAVIVLLSDGENNENPDPIEAAQSAADRGIRIYTVGIGSAAGADLDLNGFQVHSSLDAASLQQIADVTGGTYYEADDATSLHTIYDNLDTTLVLRTEQIELTALFAAAGLALLLAGAVTSLVWLGRLP